ncbi:4-(cytidine 5'-diphospho)-2-C-methyl-D-erythritol kinase [Shimia sp. FJ5]|uniref:4-(cytidine 5'-diphospho)-2-C-methyl-D-erythritol kinase n=1 Tax=Shimia sp. FJ5 TaxID=3079054 RepID=UPI00260EB7D1|nr:4-(cytidine 5'-diphospho)-2-C-methyl-D-erythritol kinase [Shimia sp. FJ5]MDV4145033.1 4-(cytidine 5'-diphospho)-2-C-methyl-D-erythritol kinase [Shimia sp. FJ5]
MKTEVFAPAKINLTLHVTGQRADGYHLLDSLVVFADIGDRIVAERAAGPSLAITGPLSEGVPAGPENLVLRAAAMMDVSAALLIDKHLPAAAGIGGGSSDAAATLRALSALSGKPLPADLGLSLGADVPVCTLARAATMRGIGEEIAPVEGLPPLPAVLVNPRVEVPTPAVFRALTSKTNPPMRAIPQGTDIRTFCDWLATERNDLEPPARTLAPAIDSTLTALSDALITRMSGSGATCFGLYPDPSAAEAAAARIRAAQPGWWVAATTLS